MLYCKAMTGILVDFDVWNGGFHVFLIGIQEKSSLVEVVDSEVEIAVKFENGTFFAERLVTADFAWTLSHRSSTN